MRVSDFGEMSTLLNRYIWIFQTIQRRGRINFAELNREWKEASTVNPYGEDLNKKTFQNYCKGIADTFGAEIACDRKDGYSYYVAWGIDSGNNLIRWQYESLAVANMIGESRDLNDRIMFEDIPSGGEFLSNIIDAMREGVTVSITHKSFWHDEATTYEVAPYGLRVIERRWYMVGLNEFGKIRIWGLDRILDIDITEHHFERPKDFSLKEYFRDSYGAIVSEADAPETVRLRVYGGQQDYLRTLPLHHSQQIAAKEDGSTVFEYRIRPTVDFRNRLLALGPDAEVLSPASLRAELRKCISAMAARYKG